MNRTTVKLLAAGLLTTSAIGLAAVAQAGGTELPPWVGDQGQTLPDKLPALIKLSTDLTREGYVWVDTALLKEPGNNGPFNAYLPSDQHAVAYWYYAGAGLFKPGTSAEDAYKSAPIITEGTIAQEVNTVPKDASNG